MRINFNFFILKKGGSPYLRDTYRYTPLLAFLMQPNIFLNKSFGKILFIIFDLICGYLIMKINQMGCKKQDNLNRVVLVPLYFWFYNPITIAISSRGNAESLMSFLVLLFVFYLKKRSYIAAGILYALSIHFKIYPVTYGLAVLFYLLKTKKPVYSYSIFSVIKSALLAKSVYMFGFSFLAMFALLTGFFYVK